MRHNVVMVFLALGASTFSVACGDRVEALTDVAACKAWSEKMQACAAAAPLVYRSALQSLAEAAAKESQNAVSAAGLTQACQAALDSTAAPARAVCPGVSWRDIEEKPLKEKD